MLGINEQASTLAFVDLSTTQEVKDAIAAGVLSVYNVEIAYVENYNESVLPIIAKEPIRIGRARDISNFIMGILYARGILDHETQHYHLW